MPVHLQDPKRGIPVTLPPRAAEAKEYLERNAIPKRNVPDPMMWTSRMRLEHFYFRKSLESGQRLYVTRPGEEYLAPPRSEPPFWTNVKTGYSVNLPVWSCLKRTRPCITVCYACRGRLTLAKQIAFHIRNYFRIVADPERFGEEVAKQAKRAEMAHPGTGEMIPVPYCRWLGSGDLGEVWGMPGDNVVRAVNRSSELLDRRVLLYSRIPEKLERVDARWRVFSVDRWNLGEMGRHPTLEGAYLCVDFDEPVWESPHLDRIKTIFLSRPSLIRQVPLDLQDRICPTDFPDDDPRWCGDEGVCVYCWEEKTRCFKGG